MVDYTQIKTAKDMIDAGIPAMTSKEKLQATLIHELDNLRGQYGITTETFERLYPGSIAPVTTAVKVTRSLIAGIDLIIFGPPGSGKTRMVNDIISMYPKLAYAVDGCDMQCNPYSLTDREFAGKVPACPKCRMIYGDIDTGVFDISKIDPRSVKVKMVQLRDGFGISRFKGSPDTYPEDLAGRIDLLQYEKLGDPFDYRVFRAGKLSHGNNGIVNINEVGKIPLKAQDVLLDALSESEVKPSNSREAVPASAIFICDTNTEDLDRISGPLNDRLMAVFFPYPETVEANYKIIERNIHRVAAASGARSLEECLSRPTRSLLNVGMPMPSEKSLCSLMIEYRTSGLCQRFEETGSNRALLDAVRMTRANAILYGRNGIIASDLTEAMIQAIEGNVRPRNTKDWTELSLNVRKFVEAKMPEKLQAEMASYWCNFAKRFEKDPNALAPVAESLQKAATMINKLSQEKNDASKSELARTKAGQGMLSTAREVVDGMNTKPFWAYVAETTPSMPVSDDSKDEMMVHLLSHLAPHISMPRTR